jgi:phage terminase small subunit
MRKDCMTGEKEGSSNEPPSTKMKYKHSERPRLRKETGKPTPRRKGPTAEDMEKGADHLNHRQRRFVSEYASSLNGTDAAIKAGYSKDTACTIGSRLLRNVHVAKAVQKAQARRLSRADITAEKVLVELAAVGFVELDPKDVKPSDKLTALNTLAKHLGLLTEKVEVDQRMSILSVSVSQADLDQARALVEGMRRAAPLIEGAKVEPDGEK